MSMELFWECRLFFDTVGAFVAGLNTRLAVATRLLGFDDINLIVIS